MKNQSTFRESLKPYRQPRPKRLPSKKQISKGSNWKSVIKQVVDATKFVVSMVNTQNKICDTFDSTLYNATYNKVIPLNLIAQGDDYNNRLGEEIHPKQLDVRLLVYKVAGTNPGAARVIIFRDNNCNGASPAFADVLSTAASNQTIAHYNYLNFQGDDMPRFSILMDELFAIAPSSDQSQAHEVSLKMADDSHIHYLGTTASTSTQGKGSLFALVVCDTTASDTTNVSISTRLNYLSY